MQEKVILLVVGRISYKFLYSDELNRWQENVKPLIHLKFRTNLIEWLVVW
jgi:hypothetical protein